MLAVGCIKRGIKSSRVAMDEAGQSNPAQDLIPNPRLCHKQPISVVIMQAQPCSLETVMLRAARNMSVLK